MCWKCFWFNFAVPGTSKCAVNTTKTTMFIENGDRYDGEWKQNKKHGMGKYKFAKGDYYEGTFEDGLKHGEGTYRYPNGDIYEGTFVRGILKTYCAVHISWRAEVSIRVLFKVNIHSKWTFVSFLVSFFRGPTAN